MPKANGVHSYVHTSLETNTTRRAEAGSQPQPDRLGFYARWPGIAGAIVDVSDQPVPVGATMTYSNATASHEGVDMLADTGCMYRGERERLYAALDENLRYKDV